MYMNGLSAGEQFGYAHCAIHKLKIKWPNLSFRVWYDVGDERFVAAARRLDTDDDRFLDRVECMLPWMHAKMHAWYVNVHQHSSRLLMSPTPPTCENEFNMTLGGAELFGLVGSV